MENNLNNLTSRILELLKEYGLGKYSISNYYYEGFKPIIDICSKHGINDYAEAEIQSALNSIANDAKSGKIGKTKAAKSRKAAYFLKEYVSSGNITLSRISHKPQMKLSDYYEAITAGFCDYLKATRRLSPNYRQSLVGIAHSFFKYLDDNGRHSIEQIDLKIVKEFLFFSTKNHPCSMNHVQRALRDLAECLLSNNDCIDFRSVLLSRPAPRRTLMPVFTDDEVDALLEEAKNSKTNPLRDTAIIQIACNLGLRAIDIVNLKLQDIDWHHSTLKFIQHKTGVECELPLEANVGNAIADYILRERPSTKESFIFIRSRAPFIGLGAPALGDMVRSYMRKSDRIVYESGNLKGFHAFRRYVATKMINADVPQDTIKDILGHLSVDSMKPYIRISRNKLALCAITLSGISVSQEEYL